jgi:putative nucleotidyltransferase with HDIG domain
MREHNMLPNIIAHSKQVMAVAQRLMENLIDGSSINRNVVIAAALLHDITKTRSLKTGERHDVTGGELLRMLGFPTLAYIVEQHVFFTDFDADGPLEEREIVYYADKCVMHDAVVSIHKRVDDLIERYGTTEERREMILKNKALILAIEAKINRHLRTDIRQVIGL